MHGRTHIFVVFDLFIFCPRNALTRQYSLVGLLALEALISGASRWL